MLRILFVKDLPSDVELVVREIRNEKLEFEHTTVFSGYALLKSLRELTPDLIILDFNISDISGLQVLKEAKKIDSGIPVIICLDTLVEETVVKCLKAGAEDCIVKDHLKQLAFTVKKVLIQANTNKKSRASDLLLKDSQDRLQSILSSVQVGIGLVIDRVIIEVNDAFCFMTGYNRSELVGKSSEIFYPTEKEYNFVGKDKYKQISEKDIGIIETKFKCKNGRVLNVILSSAPLVKNDYSKGFTFSVTDITSLIKAESELNKSYRSIDSLIENVQGMLYRRLNDKDWTMLFLSKGTKKITGFSPEELINNEFISYESIIHEDDRDFVRENVETSLDNKLHFQNIYRITTKSGEVRWVWEKGKGVFLDNGELEYLEGFITDITQRISIEEALKESQQLFETLTLASPVGVVRTNLDGAAIYMNPKWLELSGLSFEEAKGFGWLEAVHPEDRKKLKRGWSSTRRSHITSNTEYRIVRSDGTIIWVIGNVEPERIENKIVGYVGTITDITDRKQSEKDLHESEEKFRAIAENLSDVIFLTDDNGVIQYISPSCKMLGYSQEECTGRYFGEFLAEGEHDEAINFFRNALNGINLSKTVTLIFKNKNGNSFVAELTGSVFRVDGDHIGVLGLLRDISQKTIRENELRKLSLVVEQSPESILITDINGNIEYVNNKICEITGYSKQELMGANPRILSSGKMSGEDYKFLWNTIKGGNEWKGEFLNIKKNRELYWESASISPIKSETGEITHFVGIKEDITEKKMMEAAVLASEQRYRELFLNNPLPTYIFDENTLEFIEVNDATVAKYGYSREEFALMTLKDFRSKDDIPDLIDSLRVIGKDVYHSADILHRNKDGELFPVEVTSYSLPEKNGKKPRLVMAIDITIRVKAAEQMRIAIEKAEASDKLKTTFLNNISHEVRTPLNGILGFGEILSQPDLSEEEKKESVSLLFESSERLLNTITSYMDISLITSGNMSLHKREFCPEKFLRKIYEDFYMHCKNRGLELFLNLPEQEEKILINSDPDLLQKVFSHLLDNALKFTDSGSINYGYIVRDAELEFFVKDTGIGIKKDSIDTIFDRFVKVEKESPQLTEGSGLGLSIVKGIIDLIKSKIWVESELGAGSCFFFTIPLVDSYEVVVSDDAMSDDTNRDKPVQILVAEDDETNFLYIYSILSRETKASILRASNGREAIEMFKDNPFIQLILMDIKMPEVDGLEATRQIKKLNKDVTVIAVTAYAMVGDKERVLAAGCNDYLSKPISKKMLMNKLTEYISI